MKKRVFALILCLCMLSVPTVRAADSVTAEDDYPRYAPSGLFYQTKDNTLIVSDVWNKVLWTWRDGKYTALAGETGVKGLDGEPVGVYNDSVPEHAFFMEPWAVAPFLEGYAVSDTAANVLRYVTDKAVYTLSGSGKEGMENGRGSKTSFRSPTGLATDADGNLYIADTGNNAIRMLEPGGNVTTFRTGLSEPMGLCWHDGWLYVAETGKNRILRIKGSQMEVLAGTGTATEDGAGYYGGFTDGPAARAAFDHPQGVAVASDGTVYVADTLNHAIRAIRNGRVYTIAKSPNGLGMPVSPRSVLLHAKTLYATDPFAQGIFTLSVEKKAYDDVKASAWYASAVDESTARGLCNGTSATEFSPEGSVTRAMFVTMLSRLHNSADGTAVIDGDHAFSDVPADGWFSGAARWAADGSIVNGVGEGQFAPQSDISREQIVTMLLRYARAQGLSTDAPDADLSDYTDHDSVSAWATEAMRWAVGRGIMKGSDGQLTPGASATRAQVATLFINFMDAYGL